MKQKQKPKPPFYRLTLTASVFWKVIEKRPDLLPKQIPFNRLDGRVDVAISHTLKDQIETAAKPGENWCDTLRRVVL